MHYPQYQQDLNTALESEILGELIFLNAAKHTRSIEQQQKWQTLAKLETQTLRKLQQFLIQQGQTATIRLHVKLQAKASGIAMAKLSWKLAMRVLKQGTQPFMVTFERMQQHADANTQDFLHYLLAHEQALAEFATQELQGNSEHSLDAVLHLLKSEA
ncbi:hypothetical protein MN869_16620 [Acinetobacter sp. NIPH1876]|uniref:hypothetical protein n=1 Tax=Acinetobacter TaxID=469 RepID=UPI001F4A4E0A|nr:MULTISPECIES: hypothetical protein [Acinetobacter]MCH7339198.1 hypothetical protein [Acinetobacter higginsii]MCJ0830064.1 hypothetical protein [Acinetobacter sp. NIPH1876]